MSEFEELLELHAEELMELEQMQKQEEEEKEPVPDKKSETKLMAKGFSFLSVFLGIRTNML